jgi:hypothetical protein
LSREGVLGGDLRLLRGGESRDELGAIEGSIVTRCGSCESEHAEKCLLVWERIMKALGGVSSTAETKKNGSAIPDLCDQPNCQVLHAVRDMATGTLWQEPTGGAYPAVPPSSDRIPAAVDTGMRMVPLRAEKRFKQSRSLHLPSQL